MNFNKVMLVVMAMQLNLIVYFLGTIRQENDAVYRFLHLREFLYKEMTAPSNPKPTRET